MKNKYINYEKIYKGHLSQTKTFLVNRRKKKEEEEKKKERLLTAVKSLKDATFQRMLHFHE